MRVGPICASGLGNVITSTRMGTTVIPQISHELHRVLLDAADGQFPAVDGGVDIVAPMGGDRAVDEFTGHSFVLPARN